MANSYETEGFITLESVTFNGSQGSSGSSLSYTSTDILLESDENYTITDIDEDNQLDVGDDYFADVSINFTGYTITGTDGNEYGVFKIADFYFVPLPVDGTGQTLIPASGTSNTYQAEANAYLCFAEGTRIATPGGERAVETLRIGDPVLTDDGRTVSVRWMGHQTFTPRFAPERFACVRIARGALGTDASGEAMPRRDLVVTADHGMIVEGYLVNASALVNGTTIRVLEANALPARMTVWHVETEAHDAILAEGAPAETLIDYRSRQTFDNYAEYEALYGAERIVPEMARPRISSQRLLPESIRAKLNIAEDGTAEAMLDDAFGMAGGARAA